MCILIVAAKIWREMLSCLETSLLRLVFFQLDQKVLKNPAKTGILQEYCGNVGWYAPSAF